MTGNSITQSQGERSGTDRYPADAEADKDDSKRFCEKQFEWNVVFLTGRLAQTGQNQDGKPADVNISIRLIHFGALSCSASVREALGNHSKAMILLLSQPVNHINQPQPARPSFSNIISRR